MSALDLVMKGLDVAADPAGAVGSTPGALAGAIPTGFNQGLASMVGTAYNAMVNAPKMAAGVGAVLLGRPDLAPDVTDGTARVSSALDSAGLSFMTAPPAAGDLAASLVFKTSGLAPGFLFPDAEIGNVGDMAVGALVKASSLASSCPACVAGVETASKEASSLMGSAEGAAGNLTGLVEREAMGFEKSAEDLFSHLLDVVGDNSNEKK
jgi:hypothetical protein